MSFPRFVVLVAVAIVVPIALIYRQPDLGTAIILAVGILAVLLLTGVPVSIIGGVFVILGIYIAFVCIVQPYHIDRILSALDPWRDPLGDGYQSIQSLYAFGSGGVFGTGLGLSRQKYLYLPYAHTDFIYAVIGEELGLIGAVATACLFALFILGGMRICRNAPNLFGAALAGGLTTMVGFQAFVNMMCVIGIAPVTGKALPFISYGGSSVVATMITVGLILSVSMHSRVGVANEKRRDDLLVFDGGNAAGKPKDEKTQSKGRAAALGLSILQGRGSKAEKAASSRAGSSRKGTAKSAAAKKDSSRSSSSSRGSSASGRSSRTAASKSTSSTRAKSTSASSQNRSASTKKSGYASVRPMSKTANSASRGASSRSSRTSSAPRANNVTYIGTGSRTSQRTASASRNGSGSRTSASSRKATPARSGTASRSRSSQRNATASSRSSQRSSSRNANASNSAPKNSSSARGSSRSGTKGSTRLNYHDANRRPRSNSSSRSRRKR